MKLPSDQVLTPPATPHTSRLRCCLLSGGDSRRMGRDKALIDHPEGGSWLGHTLRLLADLQAPISLCSHHAAHRQVPPYPVDIVVEPEPGQGPLRALQHLMSLYPGDQLLLCAVDMPWLDADSLLTLSEAARVRPADLHISTDGTRLHPLLGVYPASDRHHRDLTTWLAGGGRSMLGWLERQPYRTVRLEASALRNCNHPGDWEPAAAAGVVSPSARATG